jgi:hypothetical protein
VSEREAAGNFDYLFEDVPDESRVDALPDPQVADDVDYTAHADEHWDDRPLDGGPETDTNLHFDAFDSDTRYFESAPPPWYRTKQTLAVLVATAVAAVTLVVSGVLVALRGSSTTVVDESTSVTQTPATTAASRTAAPTSALPPPSHPPPSPLPPPPPPPAETSAAPARPAPVQTNEPRSPSTGTTKAPEIGVTRTPVTRAPISVAPQRPNGGRH